MSSTQFLADTIIIASLSALSLIVMHKHGFIEMLQLNAGRLFGPMKNLPHCDFCLLFWLSFLLAIPLMIISNIFYIVAPFVAAPISKAIYENCRAAGQ